MNVAGVSAVGTLLQALFAAGAKRRRSFRAMSLLLDFFETARIGSGGVSERPLTNG